MSGIKKIINKFIGKPDTDSEFEKVEAMGEDNEKQAIKAVKEIVVLNEEKEKDKENVTLDYLKTKRGWTKIEYNRALSEILLVKLYEDGWPEGVSYEVIPTNIGVIMELYVKGRIFRQAVGTIGEPKYDLNAMDMFVMRAENTVEKLWKTNPQLTDRN